jgi:hypothetical protein
MTDEAIPTCNRPVVRIAGRTQQESFLPCVQAHSRNFSHGLCFHQAHGGGAYQRHSPGASLLECNSGPDTGIERGIAGFLWALDSLDRKSSTRATDCGEFSPLQPLRHTPNTRCPNAGGCQRNAFKTDFGTWRLSEHGTSHSSPAISAASDNFASLFEMPGQFLEMCAANTPA